MGDEKLNVYIPALLVPRSMSCALETATRELSMPRAQVIRLAIIAGLPLVMRSVPHVEQPQPPPAQQTPAAQKVT